MRLASSPASPGSVQFSVVGGLRESTSPAACVQIRVAVLRFTPGLSVGAGGVYLVALSGELRVKGLHLEAALWGGGGLALETSSPQELQTDTPFLASRARVLVLGPGCLWFSSPHSRGTGSKHGACFAGLQGVFLSQPTMGIRTQGAQKMPWQDLRTAREGGNGFDLRFGACAVAVSLGVGRLWPRNPLTGSARSVAFPRVSRLDCDAARSGLPGSLCGRQCDVRVLAAKRPGRHKNRAPALLPWKYSFTIQ